MPGEGRDGFTCFRDYRAEFNESRAYLDTRTLRRPRWIEFAFPRETR